MLWFMLLYEVDVFGLGAGSASDSSDEADTDKMLE